MQGTATDSASISMNSAHTWYMCLPLVCLMCSERVYRFYVIPHQTPPLSCTVVVSTLFSLVAFQWAQQLLWWLAQISPCAQNPIWYATWGRKHKQRFVFVLFFKISLYFAQSGLLDRFHYRQVGRFTCFIVIWLGIPSFSEA